MASASSKTSVGVVFGGRSTEHEVSRNSGRAIMAELDSGKYDVHPILITRSGAWIALPAPDAPEDAGEEVLFSGTPGEAPLRYAGSGERLAIDVFFPIIHGTFGEDGTLQGLFELAEVPFVGSGCASSAVTMDKAVAKAVLRAAGLPVLPALTLFPETWGADRDALCEEAASKIGYPLFVKPSSSGSSVGVHLVESPDDLQDAVADSFRFDSKVLIEEHAQGRELECSVLEGPALGEFLASPIMEITTRSGWYDYEAKYEEGRAELIIPAPVEESLADHTRLYARSAFSALGCSGLARVDFFYRERTGELYINEVNTLPGFTQLSGYPRMIRAAGVSYPEMLDRLISCARARHEKLQSREYDRNA